MTLLLALACGRDAELAPFADALAAWEAGRAALQAGRADDAAADFARASGHDGSSASLRLWRAHALAAAGRLDEADATLTELLRASPEDGRAWYNRAAYRARAGRLDDAADDLRNALRFGAGTPLDASADPDFRALRAHPAAAGLVPPQPMLATAQGPDGAVFLDSTVVVRIDVVRRPGRPLRVTRAGTDPGCLALRRVVEDTQELGGVRIARLDIELRAVAPCRATLGPWRVGDDDASLEVPAVPLVVEAPPGMPVPPVEPLPALLPVPSSLAPEAADWAAARVGEGVGAMGRVDQAASADGRAADVVLELREAGQPRARGGWWRTAGPLTVRAGAWSSTVE